MNIDEIAEKIRSDGYAIVENVIDKKYCDEVAEKLDKIESLHSDKSNTTASFKDQKVIYSPFLHDPDVFLPLIGIPLIFDVANNILGNDHVTLNGCSGSRSSGPGYGQIHTDSSMPVSNVDYTTDLLTCIALDDFTEKSGATHVWKGSHKSGMNPKGLTDLMERPERLVLEAPKGSIIFILGQTWHMTGGNTSGNRRWGFFHQYSRWFIKPMFAHNTMGPEIYSKLNVIQKQLFGFSSRPPNRPGKRTLSVMDPNSLPENYDDVMSL
jgi:ectoine hydroxylase-related dioxygenase (phytanoyl-CoA dioxygenase family)